MASVRTISLYTVNRYHGQHSLHCQQIDTVNMKLGTMDPALACSGPMSTFSYDSHPISRARWAGHYHLELQTNHRQLQSSLLALITVLDTSYGRAVQVRGRG